MRNIALGVFLTLLALQFSAAQQAVKVELGQERMPSVSEPTAVTGCTYLWDEYEKLARYVQEHPEALQTRKAAGPAWNFEVGSQYSWWAQNFTTRSYYQTASTCRAKGTTCYVFVEDSLWNVRVTQAQVDSIQIYFDSRTPAFPTKGIYQVDVETFGDPPNVDNDQRIIILILNILDGYTSGSPSFIAGYFDPRNELAVSNSNQAEIYYLDANPLNLATSGGLTNAIRTTAHEFQHMIHWRYEDPFNRELSFINEGLSEVAEVVVGYTIRTQTEYVNNTDVYLIGWSSSIADYARAARWTLYLWNQFPNNFLKQLVANFLTGIEGINSTLSQYTPPTARRFDDIFQDWLIANQLNDASVDPKYAYTYPGSLAKPTARTHADPNTGVQTENVSRLGADYITFNNGSNLNITFTTTSSDLRVVAIEVGSGGKRVVDVPVNAPFSEPAFGSSYNSITFVVINTSRSFDASYSYQATGVTGTQAIEMKWDESEPVGFLRLSVSDTICVTFNGLANTRLDSIRVALRRAGSISGGVWRYTGAVRPTPLGQRLAVPITASITTTPPLPYPVPWPNWAAVDLRSYSIDASTPFAVGFIIRSPDTPAVMVTKYPGTDPYNSYTYLNNPSSGSPNWYYITTGTDSVYIYLVRAYVSPITGVGPEDVIELTPSTYSLYQNYPNPFNPSTKIEYQLPTSGLVQLKIYDVLGREVRTLADELQQAGTYRVEWDGRDNSGREAVSGVYFYQLRTRSYVKTNKMVLLR